MGPRKGKKKMIVQNSLEGKLGENFAMKIGVSPREDGASEDGYGDNQDTSLSQSQISQEDS